MKILKIILVVFISFNFTNVGQDVEIENVSDNCIVIDVSTKEELSLLEIVLKVYNEIRYSLYRGFREYQVYKSKIIIPKEIVFIFR